jgi:hypothetical protein
MNQTSRENDGALGLADTYSKAYIVRILADEG